MRAETPDGPAPRSTPTLTGLERASAADALAKLRRWGGDDLVREMTAMFLADMPGRLAAARAALRAGDAGRVALAAHAMKSSGAQLGAAALASVCGDAEWLARSGELARVAPLLDAADAELARFVTWLERTTGGAAASDSPADRRAGR